MSATSQEFQNALRDATLVAPELPEAEAFETLAALEECERRIVLPLGSDSRPLMEHDYIAGSATEDDEVGVFGPDGAATLVSADHATTLYKRKGGAYGGTDHGTGGLALLLSERGTAQSVIPLGRQTWNVAVASDEHPIKQQIGTLLPRKAGFISLHGMAPGKLTAITDRTEIHAILGLGITPNEQSRQIAEAAVEAGKAMGLRVVIENDTPYHTADLETGGFMIDEKTGKPATEVLMARRTEMTTNYAHRVMKETGRQIPSVQLELTRMLRLLPADFYDGWHRDRKALAVGVHSGYLLTARVAELISNQDSADE